eukprot:3898225-Ditylum_brightwellii.AAC.1
MSKRATKRSCSQRKNLDVEKAIQKGLSTLRTKVGDAIAMESADAVVSKNNVVMEKYNKKLYELKKYGKKV